LENSYRLVRLDALDPRELATLRELSLAEGFSHVDHIAAEYEKGNHEFEAPGAFGYGWYLGAELVAIGGLTLDPYIEERAGRVRRVYVHPEHRRRGLARKMMERILEEARQSYSFFTLRSATPEASALYVSLGFVPSTLPNVTHEMRVEPNLESAP
jgi:GNAT superfamily N-acetyltransferase